MYNNATLINPDLIELKSSADWTLPSNETTTTNISNRYVFTENDANFKNNTFKVEKCDINYWKDVFGKIVGGRRGDRSSSYKCFTDGRKFFIGVPNSDDDVDILFKRGFKCDADPRDILRYFFIQRIFDPFLYRFIYKFDYEKIPVFETVKLNGYNLPAYFANENLNVTVRLGLPYSENQKIFMNLKETVSKGIKKIDIPDKAAIFAMRELANTGPIDLTFDFYETL